MKKLIIACCTLSLLVLSGCGSSGGDSEADAKCQLVCDKSAECGSGSAPATCMAACKSDPPTDACILCYEKETCGEVGLCYYSNCKG